MKILVTGNAGFIGSHLCEKLLATGHTVIGVDNFDEFYSKKLKINNLSVSFDSPNFTFYETDIRDKAGLVRIFDNNHIDLVIHLAAKAGVRPSIENPTGYFETNLMGTINILEVMKQLNVKNMIFASSSSVYGNNRKVPFAEPDMVDNPISPYAASKKAAELVCYNYHHLYDFNIFALRFFTVFGPRQRPDLAINKFAHRIMNGLPIDIYGNGTSSRDYTFVDDIVDGITLSMRKLKGYQVLNLGNSTPVTLNHMIEALEDEIGLFARKRYLPMQEGDVNATYADISKAQTLIGYYPKTSFEIGISRFIDWKLNELSVFVQSKTA